MGASEGATCHLCVVVESVHSTSLAEFHLMCMHLLRSLRAQKGMQLPSPTESPVLCMMLAIRGIPVNK